MGRAERRVVGAPGAVEVLAPEAHVPERGPRRRPLRHGRNHFFEVGLGLGEAAEPDRSDRELVGGLGEAGLAFEEDREGREIRRAARGSLPRQQRRVTLERAPDLAEARLGRLKSLSYLAEHAAALEEADRLLAFGEWFLGEAHFWRAWNLARLGRYEEARQDVTAARSRLHNAELYKLSGMIERFLGQPDAARAELAQARDLAPDDCEVPFLVGELEASVGRWPGAADAFVAAGTCYVREEARLRAALEQQGQPEASDPRLVARRRRQSEEAHDRQGASFFGAAVALARAGRRAEAREWAARALDYPKWAARARALLQDLSPPDGRAGPR